MQVIETDKLLEQVKLSVHAIVPNAKIILYGSRARGTARADSDWDFLILLPDSVAKETELQLKKLSIRH